MSLLAAIRVSAETLEPRYAARTVSKFEPTVSNVTLPVAGARHRYQIERPPGTPAWFGSPASLVASTLVPVTVPLEPATDWAPANMSFGGASDTVQVRLAGVASVLPAESVAATENVWVPAARSEYACGDVQGAAAALSSEQANVAASVAVKEKVALVVETVPVGPSVIVVSGGVVSTTVQ